MNKINKLYFLGAGSTASFGLPTTCQQSNIIKKLVFKDNKDDLFSNFVKHYFNENNVNINELYNIIDCLILENTSININNKIYSNKELIDCKNKITYSILNEFNKTISNNSDANEKLKYFYNRLAKDALEKKVKEYNEDIAVKRDFIFTDYAIINLNWDLYSIMPMFLAHQELNNTNNYYLSTNKVNAKLKIFNDLGMQFACNSRESKDIWFPYNESVASRVNDPNYRCNRVVTLVRSYFPHGLMNLYQCKYCHKHILNIGDLTYQSIVKNRDLLANNKVLICPFCGESISEFDLDILLQSNFKVISNYLKELRYDMINALKSTNQIVFIGYSLPSDDVDYIILFRNILANNPNVKVKVVLYDENLNKNEFNILNNNSYQLLNPNTKEVVNRYKNLFGKDVLFNFSGSPQCFLNEQLYK